MRLGGCESLGMVLGYARSEKFEDSLRLCRRLEGISKASVTREYAREI